MSYLGRGWREDTRCKAGAAAAKSVENACDDSEMNVSGSSEVENESRTSFSGATAVVSMDPRAHRKRQDTFLLVLSSDDLCLEFAKVRRSDRQ